MWAMTLGEFLPLHLVMTAGMACLLGFTWWLSRRWSPKHRFRTAVAGPLTVGGFFSGGLVFWIVNPSATSLTVAVNGAVFGMFAGQGTGFLISWWVWKYYRHEIERNEDAG